MKYLGMRISHRELLTIQRNGKVNQNHTLDQSESSVSGNSSRCSSSAGLLLMACVKGE